MEPGDAVNFALLDYTRPTGDAVNFELSQFVPPPFLFGFGVSKRILTPTSPDPLGVAGIWQMRMTLRGKVPVKMKFYTPTNPRTVSQQANRQKFADAMAAWVGLTDSQRLAYNKRAKLIGRFGWGVFIGEYYQNH